MNEAYPCSWGAVILYDEGNPVLPRSVTDGTHPDSALGIRTNDRRLRTVRASGPARSPQDARSLVGPFGTHRFAGRQGRGCWTGHRSTLPRRLPQRRPPGPAALGRRRTRQPADQPRRKDQSLAERNAGPHHRRSRRPHRTTHGPQAPPDANARVSQGSRLPVAADAGRARAPKKSLTEHVATQRAFLKTELQPALDAAAAGTGHVFFVDAAHFVFGTFLCCLWSLARIFVRAASGRQRFNVLGAWNAVTRQLIAVTNTTVVNTETMSELLREIAALGLTGPITLVLDNARYQHNAAVKALATQVGITLLFLPSYSPNLNLIERLWGFAKRQSVYGKYHATFASFRTAIESTLANLSTTHATKLKTLMTLTFQEFDDVSLLAA